MRYNESLKELRIGFRCLLLLPSSDYCKDIAKILPLSTNEQGLDLG